MQTIIKQIAKVFNAINIDDIYIEYAADNIKELLFWQVVDKKGNRLVINQIYGKEVTINGVRYLVPEFNYFATDRIIEQKIKCIIGELTYLEDRTDNNLFHNWNGKPIKISETITK